MNPSSPVNSRFTTTVLLVLVIGCSPKMSPPPADNSSKPLSQNADVLVLDLNQPLPDNCRQIGKIKAFGGDSNCTYSGAVADAKAKARKMGGNVLKITGYRDPGLGALCFQIKANVLYSADVQQLIAADQAKKDSVHRSKFGDHPDYAILYAYRPSGAGALIGYNLHLGDSVICRMKNSSKYEIRIYKEGQTTLWAKTEAKASIPLNVRFGEEYFVRCTIQMGFFVGDPDLSLIEKGPGEAGYEGINDSKSR
ncbi:MAG TPA: hypothetical protein VKQ52_00195 [Puia sp.]|nr:hypothetical protein [Puia sp.]